MYFYLLSEESITAIETKDLDFIVDDLVENLQNERVKIALSNSMRAAMQAAHPELTFCYRIEVRMLAKEEALFISNFETTCAVNEKDPFEHAKESIKGWDYEISELDTKRQQLRQKRNCLAKWLKANGSLDAGPMRYQPDDVDVPIDEDNEIAKEWREKIINLIDSEKKCTVRQLQDRLGIEIEDRANIIRQVKILGDQRILAKEDSQIVMGPNWEKRFQAII